MELEYGERIIKLQRSFMAAQLLTPELDQIMDSEMSAEVGKIIAGGIDAAMADIKEREEYERILEDLHVLLLLHTKGIFSSEDCSEHELENVEGIIEEISLSVYSEIVKAGNLCVYLEQSLTYLPYPHSVSIVKALLKHADLKMSVHILKSLFNRLILNITNENCQFNEAMSLFESITYLIHEHILKNCDPNQLLQLNAHLLICLLKLIKDLVQLKLTDVKWENVANIVQFYENENISSNIILLESSPNLININSFIPILIRVLLEKLKSGDLTFDVWLFWAEILYEDGVSLQSKFVEVSSSCLDLLSDYPELTDALKIFLPASERDDTEKPVEVLLNSLDSLNSSKHIQVSLDDILNHCQLFTSLGLKFLESHQYLLSEIHDLRLLKRFVKENQRIDGTLLEPFKSVALQSMSALPLKQQIMFLTDYFVEHGLDSRILYLDGFTLALNSLFNQLNTEVPEKNMKYMVWLLAQHPEITLQHAVNQAITNPGVLPLVANIIIQLKCIFTLPRVAGTEEVSLLGHILRKFGETWQDLSEKSQRSFSGLLIDIIVEDMRSDELIETIVLPALEDSCRVDLGIEVAGYCPLSKSNASLVLLLLIQILKTSTESRDLTRKTLTLKSLCMIGKRLKSNPTILTDNMLEVIKEVVRRTDLLIPVSCCLDWELPTPQTTVESLRLLAYSKPVPLPLQQVFTHTFIPHLAQFTSECSIDELIAVCVGLCDQDKITQHLVYTLLFNQTRQQIRNVTHTIMELYLNCAENIYPAKKLMEILLIENQHSEVYLKFLQRLEHTLTNAKESLSMKDWVSLILLMPDCEYKVTASRKLLNVSS